MLYIGAEFCPICATQRWPMTVALSHFGTFSNLQQTHSAVSDGNIPTLSYLRVHVHQPVSDLHAGGDHHQPALGELLQDPGDAHPGPERPVAGQLARTARDLPVHRHRREMAAADVAVPPHALEGESFNQMLDSVGNNDNSIGATSTPRPRC